MTTTRSREHEPAGHRPISLAIAVYDNVVCADFAIPLETFARVSLGDGRPGYKVKLCGASRPVTTEHLSLMPQYTLAPLKTADTIVVPGMSDLHAPPPNELISLLKKASRRGARIASICTGAFVLAEAGLLDGRAATTHWGAADELARRHPDVSVNPNVLYVDEGSTLTSAGASAGLDLCLHMVRADYGAAIAAQAARAAVSPLERSGGQAQFIGPKHLAHTGLLYPLLRWVERNLTRDLSVGALAEQANVSVRTLHRRFQDETGMSPGAWVLRARIRRAQQLLETTDENIDCVAAKSGFGTTSNFRERFCQALDVSPRAYRRSFRS